MEGGGGVLPGPPRSLGNSSNARLGNQTWKLEWSKNAWLGREGGALLLRKL